MIEEITIKFGMELKLTQHSWKSQLYIYVFNSIVTRLSWHVLGYLISKNLCSLQNAQPFIFQFICMQLYKCINCFLETHNKQLNQYCLNFIIIFIKEKVLKNGSCHESSCESWVNPFLLQVKKIRFGLGWVKSENSDLFCHV